jgi:hypothetical protein
MHPVGFLFIVAIADARNNEPEIWSSLEVIPILIVEKYSG